MTGKPMQQTFGITVPTEIPSSILGLNVVSIENSLTNAVEMTGDLQAFFAVEKFIAYQVSKVTVANPKWVSSNGKLAINFNMTFISDPISAQEVEEIIGLLLIGIGIAFAIPSFGATIGFVPIGIAAYFSGTAFIAGIIVITLSALTAVENSAGGVLNSAGGLGAVAVIVGIAMVGVVGYMYLKEPKRRQSAHRYVGKAKNTAKKAYRSVRG